MNRDQERADGGRSTADAGHGHGFRRPDSRVLHLIDRVAGRPVVAVAVVVADLVWVLYSVLFGFPAALDVIFQTLVAALTLAIVFVIQHTQTRQQVATSASSTKSCGHSRTRTTRSSLSRTPTTTPSPRTRSSHPTLRREALNIRHSGRS